MVVGSHLIWTVYGWWLPNDPRGSSSHEIRVERIADLGELHYGRKRIQPSRAELRRFQDEAREILHHDVLMLNDDQIELVGETLGEAIRERGWTCYACAVLPEHIHLLIRRHRDKAETMLNCLQDKTKQELISAGRRPAAHPVWGGPGWKVFQSTREDMERTIKYIEDNPAKAGRPRQYWDFVKEYDGWMPAYRR
jgi:REP element-mobilizing transposase RayT